MTTPRYSARNGMKTRKLDSYDVKVVCDIELSQEEQTVLYSICIVDKVVLSDFEHEQEAALAKLRMEIVQEHEHEDLTNAEIQEVQESDAKTRQVYDPLDKKYDASRRRAIDPQECARVTLPKPLGLMKKQIWSYIRKASKKYKRNILTRILTRMEN